ncbi:hypothetical protein GJV03_14515 [Acinetobacter sp. RIT698]|uniref:hypothetical protein n=1 Tax=Acinetobacter sp. RIT698 TaxID=2666192 RepID=UPI0012ACB4F5|nr:hypothetical protein [Acinetobacter sp. RIT698]MRT38379.1 hypothetical protein [Acinetobacter sp. RIT698]
MVVLPWGDMDVAPCVWEYGGTGRPPAQHEQKQSTAMFAAQGLASTTKSQASPTQRY